ncbi:hypothetical protein EMIT0162MI3_30514 [Pseudomonas chlororaphis]
MFPGPLMFTVGVVPLLPGPLLAWAERARLHFEQPVHGLFGDLGADVRRAGEGSVHRAK